MSELSKDSLRVIAMIVIGIALIELAALGRWFLEQPSDFAVIGGVLCIAVIFGGLGLMVYLAISMMSRTKRGYGKQSR